jgi:hypothetical protein
MHSSGGIMVAVVATLVVVWLVTKIVDNATYLLLLQLLKQCNKFSMMCFDVVEVN